MICLLADLQLDVKGCKDVYASFDKYVEVERLEGDNKYQAEGHGLQVGCLLSFYLYVAKAVCCVVVKVLIWVTIVVCILYVIGSVTCLNAIKQYIRNLQRAI